jgi:hypothetical protein
VVKSVCDLLLGSNILNLVAGYRNKEEATGGLVNS